MFSGDNIRSEHINMNVSSPSITKTKRTLSISPDDASNADDDASDSDDSQPAFSYNNLYNRGANQQAIKKLVISGIAAVLILGTTFGIWITSQLDAIKDQTKQNAPAYQANTGNKDNSLASAKDSKQNQASNGSGNDTGDNSRGDANQGNGANSKNPKDSNNASTSNTNTQGSTGGPTDLFPNQNQGGEAGISPDILKAIRANTNDADNARAFKIAQAKSVVFVVHASGIAADIMPSLLLELKKLMSQMKEHQKLAVVFSDGNTVFQAPPGGLSEATRRRRDEIESWIDLNLFTTQTRNITNPMAAFESAMNMKPELLWVISDGVSGNRSGQLSQKQLLERVKALTKSSNIHISATQCIYPDVTGTLKNIAKTYGGAYYFIGGKGISKAD